MSFVRMRTARVRELLGALMIAAIFCAATAQAYGNSSGHKSCSCDPLLIQGRILAVEGKTLTLKPPEAYPGNAGGVHAQFVLAAPPIRLDISHARILFANGKEEDKRSFAVGEHVVVVLARSRSAPPSATKIPNANQLYFACVIERIETGDKIVTH